MRQSRRMSCDLCKFQRADRLLHMRQNLKARGAKMICLFGLCALGLAKDAYCQTNRFESTKRAAQRGDAKAQFALGRMYENGDGVRENAVRAACWYRKAAERGDAAAQY